jgi:hypothetical protein
MESMDVSALCDAHPVNGQGRWDVPNLSESYRKESAVVFRELAEALLAEGRELIFTARGFSMAPFIHDGECVRVRPLRSRPRRGEVVLCRSAQSELFLHRVVRFAGAAVVTRGDAAATEDLPSPISQVIGRAVAVSGRRRLHLCFPFGWILPLRRWRCLRSITSSRIGGAVRRLRTIGARI